MKQLIKFALKEYFNKIYKLNKTLYDLKQFPRIWYNTFVKYMKEIDLVLIDVDFSVFINLNIDVIITLYVNDILVIDLSRFKI